MEINSSDQMWIPAEVAILQHGESNQFKARIVKTGSLCREFIGAFLAWWLKKQILERGGSGLNPRVIFSMFCNSLVLFYFLYYYYYYFWNKERYAMKMILRVMRIKVIINIEYLVLCAVYGRCLHALICKVGLNMISTLQGFC